MKARFVIALGALALALPAACHPDLVAPRCGEIPAGGCPRSKADSCEDPSCDAVYVCTLDSVWSRERTCGPRDAGPDVERAQDAPAATRDVAIDAPPGAWGGPGCIDLQPPDCPLGRVLACAAGSCCGCEDLFVCEAGAWQYWGACDQGNPVPLVRDR